MLQPGATAKLEIILAFEDVNPGDRLVKQVEQFSLPYFQPRAPERKVSGMIIDSPGSVGTQVELSRLQVVVLTLGERDGIDETPGTDGLRRYSKTLTFDWWWLE